MGSSTSTTGSLFDASVQADADGKVTIEGDLTVEGTTTSIETVNLKVEDKLIELGNGTAGTPSGDGGIILERGSATNASLIWDESADTWVVSTTDATGSSSGDLTLTDAALKAAAITASGDISTTGDIILDDGGSLKEAGGTAAVTFDGSGNVTKIGQDSMSSGDVLTWDGAKFVGEAPTVGDITGVTAGNGLSGGGNSGAVTVALDLNELSAATVDVANDSVAIVDANDSNASKKESIADLVSGIASTGITASSGTLAITAAQTGITSVKNTGLVVGRDADNDIDFGTDNNIIFRAAGADQVVLKDGVLEPVTDADVDLGASAKQFKDGYFHGTLEADAITVGGTALNTVIAGVTVTNATNATNSTNATNATNSAHVLVTDNESTAEENLITFVEGATSTTGNVGLEMDGHLTYNPSTGTVSATVFKGNIDAVDGDFDGTLEADAITVGGANLTTIYSPIAGSGSIVTTGALNAGSITSGFTSIDVGAGAISTTGTVTTGVVNSTVTAATGVSIDQNYSVTDASNTTCLSIDFDKTGTSTTNNTMIGINLDMDSTAATGGTNTMTGIKVTPTLTQASGSAQNFTIKGMEVIATGSASPEESVVRALDLIATGGDFNQGIFMEIDDGGPDIKMLSSADNADFCTISTGANGEVTIATTDGGAAAGHINLFPDGDVVIKGATPKLIIGDAGAEDTMLVFDGNAQDFRIGLDDGTDTLEIGKGSAHGTTTAIKIDANVNVQIMHNSAVADGEVSGDMTLYQAGEDLTAGELVYFKSDGKVWKAVATAAATARCVAMATESITANNMGPFLLKGFARFNSEFPTWTVGGHFSHQRQRRAEKMSRNKLPLIRMATLSRLLGMQ